jgi:hypothetical protein
MSPTNGRGTPIMNQAEINAKVPNIVMEKEFVNLECAQELQGHQRIQTIITMKLILETNAQFLLVIQIIRIEIITVMVTEFVISKDIVTENRDE